MLFLPSYPLDSKLSLNCSTQRTHLQLEYKIWHWCDRTRFVGFPLAVYLRRISSSESILFPNIWWVLPKTISSPGISSDPQSKSNFIWHSPWYRQHCSYWRRGVNYVHNKNIIHLEPKPLYNLTPSEDGNLLLFAAFTLYFHPKKINACIRETDNDWIILSMAKMKFAFSRRSAFHSEFTSLVVHTPCAGGVGDSVD